MILFDASINWILAGLLPVESQDSQAKEVHYGEKYIAIHMYQ